MEKEEEEQEEPEKVEKEEEEQEEQEEVEKEEEEEKEEEDISYPTFWSEGVHAGQEEEKGKSFFSLLSSFLFFPLSNWQGFFHISRTAPSKEKKKSERDQEEKKRTNSFFLCLRVERKEKHSCHAYVFFLSPWRCLFFSRWCRVCSIFGDFFDDFCDFFFCVRSMVQTKGERYESLPFQG